MSGKRPLSAGLPIAIHADGGASVDFHATPAGAIRYGLEHTVLFPLNVSYHLASFVAEGVFERIPQLRIVCADGGLSALTPLIWRLDKDWRSSREEIPWTHRFPSEYLSDHVRFCLHQADLPHDRDQQLAWWQTTSAATLLLYGSNYPQRDFLSPELACSVLDESTAQSVLFDNAADLYKLHALAQSGGR